MGQPMETAEPRARKACTYCGIIIVRILSVDSFFFLPYMISFKK